MRTKRLAFSLIAFALFLLLAPGLFVSAARETRQDVGVDEDGIQIWTDDRLSDEPLRGPDVVRRDTEEVNSLVAQEDFTKSWIIVLDGVRLPSGGCGTHLEFSEDAGTATSKVFFETAFDRSTCVTEWVVGIPAHPVVPQEPDLEVVTVGEEAEGTADQRVEFMSPEVAAQLGDGALYYNLPQIRYTVVAEWKDVVNKTVNRVNSAVKAHVKNDDTQNNQKCKNQRARLLSDGPIVSHWQDLSTGHWAQADCVKGNKSTEAITSARFKNEDFALCDQLNDPAWVYYEGVHAKANSNSPQGTFTYGYTTSYQDGCNRVLHWAGFRTYEQEYNAIDPV